MRFALQVRPSAFLEYPIRKNPPPEIVDFMEGFMEFLAKRFVRELRKAVNQRKYAKQWAPLSDDWRKRKKKMKLDPRMWKASGEMLESIHWWHSKKDDCWYVGVHPRKRHSSYVMGGIHKTKKQKALIIDIIRWLEMGTRNMPPRPLFSLVLRDIKRLIPVIYQEYITSVKGKRSLNRALQSSAPMPNVGKPKVSSGKSAPKKTAPKSAPKKTAPKSAPKKAKARS